MTHTSTQQPEALRIADLLEQCSLNSLLSPFMEVANELRSQHARIAELEAQLSAIGAGGVEPLRKRAVVLPASAAQEENHVDKLFDAVLNCPHSITHESVTLHFYPRQKDGHNALSQLRHRLADYDLAARQREMQLLSEIEALERVALNALKQLEESTHTTKKGMGGNWLTVVYRDIQPGDEARAIADHPKASALSWSHALHDREAAIAAQAKQGEQQ